MQDRGPRVQTERVSPASPGSRARDTRPRAPAPGRRARNERRRDCAARRHRRDAAAAYAGRPWPPHRAGFAVSTTKRSPKCGGPGAAAWRGTGALASARASVLGMLPASFRSIRRVPSCCAAIFRVCLVRPRRGAHLSKRCREGITLRLFRGTSRPPTTTHSFPSTSRDVAIDTSLIVRYLVGDDPGQAARARRLIDNNDVFVCTTVLLNTEWVLRSGYGFSSAQCAKGLSDFAGLPHVKGEDAAAAAMALGWMRQGVDFADGL